MIIKCVVVVVVCVCVCGGGGGGGQRFIFHHGGMGIKSRNLESMAGGGGQ